MNKISNITRIPYINSVKNYSSTPISEQKVDDKTIDNTVVDSYLASKAVSNISFINRVSFKQAPVMYKNNLRTMIQNNFCFFLLYIDKTLNSAIIKVRGSYDRCCVR